MTAISTKAPGANGEGRLGHVDEYLAVGQRGGASDVHLGVNVPPLWRLHGTLQPIWPDAAKLTSDETAALAEGFLRRGARLVTGGTDNHIVLLDVTSFGLTGRQAESALLDSGVVTNRNSIPADPNGAWYTSGIRLGTPALTTRGFGADDFDRVAELIVDVLSNTQAADGPTGSSKAKYKLADGTAQRVHAAAAELLDANPLYPGLSL